MILILDEFRISCAFVPQLSKAIIAIKPLSLGLARIHSPTAAFDLDHLDLSLRVWQTVDTGPRILKSNFIVHMVLEWCAK